VIVQGKKRVRADDLDAFIEGLEHTSSPRPARRRRRRGRDYGFLRE
jgi:hypothetical protein